MPITFILQKSHFIYYGAEAKRLESRALNRENPGSNRLAAVSNLCQFRSSHVATVHLAVRMSTWP